MLTSLSVFVCQPKECWYRNINIRQYTSGQGIIIKKKKEHFKMKKWWFSKKTTTLSGFAFHNVAPKICLLCEIPTWFDTNYHTFLLDIFSSYSFQDSFLLGFPLVDAPPRCLILFSTFWGPSSLILKMDMSQGSVHIPPFFCIYIYFPDILILYDSFS